MVNVNWKDPTFKSWLAGYNKLYDPDEFNSEMNESDWNAGKCQDIHPANRYPTWEKGVSGVQKFNKGRKIGGIGGAILRTLGKSDFWEVMSNAGVSNDDIIDCWAVALVYRTGYTEQDSTRVRW